MGEDDIVRLVDRLDRDGVDMRADAAGLLAVLSRLISRWNEDVNLVSRKDIARLVSYHFYDSASVLPLLRPRRSMHVLDIGGSNGLPGLVLFAASPHLRLTICDSKLKRRGFMDEACVAMGEGASYELGRVDSKAFRADHAQRFDVIVARAVTDFRTLLKWCMPLLKPGGRVVAYKGSRCLEEVRQAEKMLVACGVSLLAVMGSPWADDCNPLRLFAIAGSRLQ
jgi:16S rRNA (guanine527-N7)-methyltransferase